jgi:hypothetical protein
MHSGKRFLAPVLATMIAALTTGGIALATGATDNQAFVDGKVSPKKLDKKKRKPVNLFVGVRTEGPVTGTQQNPEQERISFSKDIRWNGNKAPRCRANITVPGLTTGQARSLCPAKSFLGKGEAEVALSETARVGDITVSVFNGPGRNQIRLHTASPTLGAAAPTVFGKVVKSNQGRKYGQMLVVADAPDAGADAFLITKFNAKIKRSTKVAKARCKQRKFRFLRAVTYDDGSIETVQKQQKCKRKKGRRK